MADTKFIPIDLRNPAVSHNQGNSFFDVQTLAAWEGGSDDFDAGLYAFIDTGGSDDCFWYGFVRVPPVIGGTPASALVLDWTANDATSNKVRWQSRIRHVAATETLNGTPTETIGLSTGYAHGGSAWELNNTVIAFGTQPAVNDLLMVEIGRINSDTTNDTMAATAHLITPYFRIDLS